MRCRAELSFSTRRAKELLAAVKPDVKSSERVKTSLSAGKDEMTAKVEADNIASLSAGVNTVLRLARAAGDILEKEG